VPVSGRLSNALTVSFLDEIGIFKGIQIRFFCESFKFAEFSAKYRIVVADIARALHNRVISP